jgi:hypothetical protein
MRQLERVCGQWVAAHAALAWRRRRARLWMWRGRPARHIAWRRQHEGARSLGLPLRRRAPSAPCWCCCLEAPFAEPLKGTAGWLCSRFALNQKLIKAHADARCSSRTGASCEVIATRLQPGTAPHIYCLLSLDCEPDGTCVHPSLTNRRVGSPQVPLKSWQAPILVIGLTLSCVSLASAVQPPSSQRQTQRPGSLFARRGPNAAAGRVVRHPRCGPLSAPFCPGLTHKAVKWRQCCCVLGAWVLSQRDCGTVVLRSTAALRQVMEQVGAGRICTCTAA